MYFGKLFLLKEGKASNTAGTLLEETMSGVVMNKDITEVREARKCVKDAMEDFDVSDVVMWTAHDVRWVLEEIWNRFVKYRE